MARIRTIKPEFWTDEKIVHLPYEARLLFIGVWNFCDDEGYLMDEPDRVRMQVLPNDDVDSDLLIDLLVTAGLLDRLVLQDGETALRVPHFQKHQKVSHSSPSKIAPEVSRKLAIPAETRRAVAIRAGCQPGGSADATCYYCGAPGSIWWPNTSRGRPSGWVAFSGLELDHVTPEREGGQNTPENIVLACRHCNRSKGTKSVFSFVLRNAPEPSGTLPPERKGKEGKGKEDSAPNGAACDQSLFDHRPKPEAKKDPGRESDEDRFWRRAAELEARGVPRSRCGQLAKMLNGDFAEGVAVLRDVAEANEPSKYLGAIIRNRKNEDRAGPDPSVPGWVSEARADGYPVTKEGQRWRMCGALYDDAGEQVGC